MYWLHHIQLRSWIINDQGVKNNQHGLKDLVGLSQRKGSSNLYNELGSGLCHRDVHKHSILLQTHFVLIRTKDDGL